MHAGTALLTRHRPITKLLMVLGVLLVPLLRTSAASSQGADVVASTPWAAAFVRGAGVEDMRILAPMDMRDPSTYTLTSEDVAALRDAKWIIYAGDEGFASQLVEAASSSATLLQINTENTPENIERETARIAAALGTEATQAKWIAHFSGIASRVKAAVNANYPAGTKVVVHPAHAAFARWLGFEIVGELASPDLASQEVQALAEKGSEIVIDSYHQPFDSRVAEAAEALYVQFINYPGLDQTATLEEVFRYNHNLLVTYPPTAKPKSTAEKALPMLAGIAGMLLAISLISFLLLRRLQRS